MRLLIKPNMITFVVVTLIFLGVSSTETEIDDENDSVCYWCGPLADQVHRSQRPPSCDDPKAATIVCDVGHPYCATIATSPPYTESRLCVKLYQDECYSLYCNTTRTWRMTCPCKTPYCNGINTERELTAFQYLSKLASNTKKSGKGKIKRSIPENDEAQVVNMPDEETGKPSQNGDNQDAAKESIPDNKEETHETDNHINTDDHIMNETKANSDEETENNKSTEVENANKQINTDLNAIKDEDNKVAHDVEATTIKEYIMTTATMKAFEQTTMQDIKTPANIENDIQTQANVNEIQPDVANDVQTEANIVTTANSTKDTEPIKTIEHTTSKIEPMTTPVANPEVVTSKMKEYEKLPPAESLQQGAAAETQETKPNEVTTAMATTIELTTESVQLTTPHKAYGNQLSINTLIILVNIVLVNYF